MNQKEKNVYHSMVECLFDEIQGSLAHQRYNEWEITFIKDLNTRFFNDNDYELSSKQTEALVKIWEKP